MKQVYQRFHLHLRQLTFSRVYPSLFALFSNSHIKCAGEQGSIRMAVHLRRKGALQTEVTIVGKNEIYNTENLVGPFWVDNFFGSRPSPPPPLLIV